MARPANLEGTSRLELRLPTALKRRLVAQAERQQTSASALIVAALERFLGDGVDKG